MTQIKETEINKWQPELTSEQAEQFTLELEQGKAFFLPELKFSLQQNEVELLDESLVKKGRKNISFYKGQLKGASHSEAITQNFMQRYQQSAIELVTHLFPHYKDMLEIGRTSLRVLDTASRTAPSYRKDDTRLHIDAFPATPMHGKRMLRVFHNINPYGKARSWRVGESFEDLIARFKDKFSKPILGERKFLQTLKITKQYRSLYDHYMLQLHDKMKFDLNYQQNVHQENIDFPAGSTWIVYSDQVSHAAMAGQHMLEQTFYLEVDNQLHPELSPLKQLENLMGEKLV